MCLVISVCATVQLVDKDSRAPACHRERSDPAELIWKKQASREAEGALTLLAFA